MSMIVRARCNRYVGVVADQVDAIGTVEVSIADSADLSRSGGVANVDDSEESAR